MLMKVMEEIDLKGIRMGSRIMGFWSRGAGLEHSEDRCSRSFESLISCLDMEFSSDGPKLSQKETEAAGCLFAPCSAPWDMCFLRV